MNLDETEDPPEAARLKRELESRSMTDKGNRNWWSQNAMALLTLSMSALTLVFTPLLTGYIVHTYWKEEQKILAQQKEFQTKLKVFTDATGQINRTNTLIQSNQVFLLSRDTAILLARILKPLKHPEVEFYWKQFLEYKEKTQGTYLQLQEAKNNLHQTRALCGIVFGTQVLPLFATYFATVGALEGPLLQVAEIENILKQSIAGDPNLERANSLVGSAFDARYQSLSHKLNNDASKILDLISGVLLADYKDKKGIGLYITTQ